MRVYNGVEGLGWSTMRGALDSDRPECYQYEPLPNKPTVYLMKFLFAFQDGRWIFRDAIRTEYGNSENVLLSLWANATYPVTTFSEPEAERLNSVWRDLVH